MEITEVPFELDPAEIVSGLTTDLHLLEPRSPGTHQSDVIRDLENTVLKPGLRKPDIEVTDDEMATLNRYREMGMMWEIVLESVFKHRRVGNLDSRKFLRQVEHSRDGIFATADAIHMPDWRVLEYKLTFRSASRTLPDRFESEFWAWFVQLKNNCYIHETRLASLFAMFVNGTYHPPVPMTKRWDIVFDEQELADNWLMMTQHRDVMVKAGKLK